MAIIFEYYHIFLFPLCIIFLSFFRLIRTHRKGLLLSPTNWPLVGMLPAVVRNTHRLHDYITEVLIENGGTFEFKGPLFSNMDMVVTCDPLNINHIFSKRFSNYPKGPEFKKIFEILGDGIFSSDCEMWELHRRATLSILNQPKFYTSLESTTWETVKTGLVPVLNHFFQQGTVMDMQDILERFSFDNICQLFLNYNPCSLSTGLPHVPCEEALNDALEPLLHRYMLPESIWKLQKWLNIGNEKKLTEAWKAFDDFIYQHIFADYPPTNNNEISILAVFRKAYEESKSVGFSGDLRQFSRDSFLGLLFAGRDSLSTSLTWFFWLLAKNPSAETKILDEIETVLLSPLDEKSRFFDVQECKKLVYLHAALYETLRLYPPIALELKSPIRRDILPSISNNRVEKNTKVVISFYSTGRMESVWGKDCLDFKPERWISDKGVLRHEPSFNYPAFNVGPRSCPGKEMAFVEMKMVAVAIMHRYRVRLVEGHPVSTRDSVMLKAKHGLKVMLLSRKEDA